MRVTLDEVSHTYTDGRGLIYKSVSSIISQYKQPFDPHRVTENKKTILENFIDKNGGTAEQHLTAWDNHRDWACEKGHAFHSLKELIVNARGIFVTMEGVELPVRNIELVWQAVGEGRFDKLLPGVYTELVMWNLITRTAGTADVVIVYPDRTFDILDYKTNGKFQTRPWWDKVTKTNRRMKYPCFEQPDCHLGHYTVQLNIYAWFLIQFGLKPRNLRILHYDIPTEDVPSIVQDGILPEIEPTSYEIDYNPTLTKTIMDLRKSYLQTLKHKK
jgi:hypothetical protein